MPEGNALDNARSTRNIARHTSRQKHRAFGVSTECPMVQRVQKSSANRIGRLAKRKLLQATCLRKQRILVRLNFVKIGVLLDPAVRNYVLTEV